VVESDFVSVAVPVVNPEGVEVESVLVESVVVVVPVEVVLSPDCVVVVSLVAVVS
jgi:hypothetical protein